MMPAAFSGIGSLVPLAFRLAGGRLRSVFRISTGGCGVSPFTTAAYCQDLIGGKKDTTAVDKQLRKFPRPRGEEVGSTSYEIGETPIYMYPSDTFPMSERKSETTKREFVARLLLRSVIRICLGRQEGLEQAHSMQGKN